MITLFDPLALRMISWIGNLISKECMLGPKIIICGMWHTSKGHTSMTALVLPCVHHEQSQIINSVALRSYLKAISPPCLTTFPLSTLKEPQGYSSFKMDIFNTDASEWQLDRIFGLWNSAIHGIGNWIQVAGTHRSAVVLDRVYKVFFHSKDFHEWAHRPDQILLATFMLALEIEFERALCLCNEGYETMMTMAYHSHSTYLPTSIQYHQQPKLPSTPQITRNQWYPPLSQHQNEDQ